MKRYLTAVLAAALVLFSFAACSADDGKVGGGNLVDDAESVVSDVIDDVESAVSQGKEDVDSMLDGDDDSGSSQNDNDTVTGTNSAMSTEAAEGSLSVASSLSNEKIGWGQGTNLDSQNRPVAAVKAAEQYGKYSALFLNETPQEIMLTFDEGYENGYTAQILDVLQEKGVSAVFFITGDYAERQPELVQRMIDEGHTVGNHSWSHNSMPTLSEAEQAEDIMKLHEYIEENFGYTMTLFRYPMGEFSEQSLSVVQSLGYTSVFWSFAYKDWVADEQLGEAAAFEKVATALHPGAVYLLHAVSSDNAAILADFIDEAREQGYVFTA